MKICFYLSSGGVEHAERASALGEEFIKAGIECHFVGEYPEEIFPKNEQFSIIRKQKIDFGDIPAKPAELKEKLLGFWKNKEEIISREVKFLREKHIDLVIADIPPSAFEASFRAGVPCIAVSNSSRHYFYKNIFGDDKEINFVLNEMSAMQKTVFTAYRLPFSDEFSMDGFARLIDTGIIAKNRQKTDLRKKYDIPRRHKIVLLADENFGENKINPENLLKAENITVISSQSKYNHKNFRFMSPDENLTAVLAECDIFIGKPTCFNAEIACQNGVHLILPESKNIAEEKIIMRELGKYSHKTVIPLAYRKKADWNKIFDEIKKEGRIIPERYKSKTVASVKSIIKEYSELFPNRKVNIDVGTNNVLLLWASVDKEVKAVHRRSASSALGKDMKDRMISKDGFDRVIKILDNFTDYSRLFSDDISITGTSCSRDARNIGDLIKKIKDRYGTDYKILSEKEEAYASGNATLGSFPDLRNFLVFDIGGGSTEFTLIKNRKITDGISLKLGIRRLDNMFGNDTEAKIKYTREQLNLIPEEYKNAEILIGTGGTASGLSSAKFKLPRYDSSVVHKSTLTLDEVNEFYNLFLTLEKPEIIKFIPYEPVRAELLTVGTMLIKEIMNYFEKKEFLVSDRGMQFGLFD
ncbi:MAG: hypothetical protein CSB55_03110 [Candidatus Cloacimonadota bacterium]|nr:MAG: hypothetical protein CSB55_03110 [Candidatus Cloacimonadota bacterium]